MLPRPRVNIVSKQIGRHYLPQRSRVWVKSKCLNRAKFVIVGSSDPKWARHGFGALTDDCSTLAALGLACPSRRSPCCMSG